MKVELVGPIHCMQWLQVEKKKSKYIHKKVKVKFELAGPTLQLTFRWTTPLRNIFSENFLISFISFISLQHHQYVKCLQICDIHLFLSVCPFFCSAYFSHPACFQVGHVGHVCTRLLILLLFKNIAHIIDND